KTLVTRPAVSYDPVSPWMKSTMPIPSTAIGSRATSPARENLSAPGSAKISEYVRSMRPILRRGHGCPRPASALCCVDERAGLLLHLRQVVGTAEGLRVDLEDVLGAGGAGREPRVVGPDHQAADRRTVAGGLGEDLRDVIAGQLGARHVRRAQLLERGLLRGCGGSVDPGVGGRAVLA